MLTYTTADTLKGKLTCKAKLLISMFLVKINVNNPANMEPIAAIGPHDRNTGINPKSMGMAIGPTNAPNQEMIKPSIPPKYSYWSAIRIVKLVKMKVVILATTKEDFPWLNFSESVGKISLVITAEMVLMSEEVMDMVLANKEAMTNPTKPEGKSNKVNSP